MSDKDARLTGTPPADEAHSVRGGFVQDVLTQVVSDVITVGAVGGGAYVVNKAKGGGDPPKGKHHKGDTADD